MCFQVVNARSQFRVGGYFVGSARAVWADALQDDGLDRFQFRLMRIEDQFVVALCRSIFDLNLCLLNSWWILDHGQPDHIGGRTLYRRIDMLRSAKARTVKLALWISVTTAYGPSAFVHNHSPGRSEWYRPYTSEYSGTVS